MNVRLLASWTIAVAAAAGSDSAAQVGSLQGDLIDITTGGTHPDYPGISTNYVSKFSMHTEAGGVSAADFDNDGLLDLFYPGNQGFKNKLYHNNGDGTFTDQADARGVSDIAAATSVGLFIDYDRDGDRDLFCFEHAGMFLTSYAAPLVHVFRNNGAPNYTFVNVTAQCAFVYDPATVKPTTKGLCGGATAGDYSGDGFLDLFVGYWQGTANTDMWRLWKSVPNPVPGSPSDPSWSPRIFVDQTVAAGLNIDPPFNPVENASGEAWQSTFVDLNRDHWPDLRVAIDFNLDYFFVNNQDGTFTEVATAVGLNGNPTAERNEMGAGWGDCDNDGDIDLHTTNLGYVDRFYRNDTVGHALAFVDIAPDTGTLNSAWGWGDIQWDFDNDGDLDHSTVSGFKFPTANPFYPTLHLNLLPLTLPDGITPLYQDVSTMVPEFSLTGTAQGKSARGLVSLDLDGDGDLDLAITRSFDIGAVYQNTLASGNDWIAIDAVGRGGHLAVENARVHVKHGATTQTREIVTGSSFLCQEPSRSHFGLGSGGGADLKWVVIRWPGNGGANFYLAPTPNAVNVLQERLVNDLGDMNADGSLTSLDKAMLGMAIQDAAVYEATFPNSPGLILGDINGDGLLDRVDLRLWEMLPPHVLVEKG